MPGRSWPSFLRSPPLDGEPARERARTLHEILRAGLLINVAALLASVALRPLALPNHFPYAAMVLVHVAALLLGRRGHVHAAVSVFAVTYLAIVGLAMVSFGGLRSPAGFVLPPLVLFVGLTWSGLAAAITALAASGMCLVLVLFERAGRLPGAPPIESSRIWVVATAALAITAAMLYVALRTLRRSRAALVEHERRRADLEERLHEAHRLETVGRLAAGVAHDFNNVLAVILAQSHFLSRRDDAKTAECGREIGEAAARGAALAKQLLSAGKRQVVFEPKILDVREVVQGLAPLLRKFAGRTARLELALGDAPRPAKIDRTQLEQVLMNLVGNAGDAMPRGGAITVSTEADGASGGVRLRVEDQGEGMDEAVRAKIFEPFFTTKAPGRGTGLGLATVRGIVEEHGGRIEVESAPGKGSTFTVVLPAPPGTVLPG